MSRAEAPAVPAETRAFAGPAARGETWLRGIDARLAWLDGWVARWVPVEWNLLAEAGAAANAALLVATVSGVLLLVWYSPSVQLAYPSLAALDGRSLGGWMRALHRYSSDLAMLLLVVHAGRTFVARKFAGARWLAWVSGVLMMALIWFIGWTGYWLVWDQPAQQVAVSSMRLLDALPVFGEPLGRLYVLDRTVPSLLFFVIFFLHMLLPLGIAIGLVVHVARINRARLLPRRGLWIPLVIALGAAALWVPAPLDARAEMTLKAPAFTVDAWYLSPLALGLRFQSAGLWVALFGGVALGALVPWIMGRRRPPADYQAVVTPARCHACTQCVQDCPFDAITMVARTDGRRFPSQAQVDPTRCVGCGVCSGSCDSGGIGLGWFDTRVEEARIEQAAAEAMRRGGVAGIALAAADISGKLPALPGFETYRVPTASWVRPNLIERLFELGSRAVLIVRDANAESWGRDGGRWVQERIAGARSPRWRRPGLSVAACRVVDFDPSRPEALSAVAAGLLGGTETGRPRPRRGTKLAAALLVALVATVAAVAPSHLRVANPASPEPELVVSFKVFGALLPASAVDPSVEAAKPVHMRGRTVEKPRRAAVVLRVTIDGVTTEHTYAAKGVTHDGPAIGEWRTTWTAGEHDVIVEILPGAGAPAHRWAGRVTAELRRTRVIAYDAAGYVTE